MVYCHIENLWQKIEIFKWKNLKINGSWSGVDSTSGSEPTDATIGAAGKAWMKSWSADSTGVEKLSRSDGDEGKDEDNLFELTNDNVIRSQG